MLRDFLTRAPLDGTVANGAILLQRDETTWTIAKGWAFEPPTGTGLQQIHALAQAAIETLPLEFGLQVILSSEVDAMSDIETQHANAPQSPTPEAELVKQHMLTRLRKKRDAGELRRLRCYIFVGTHLSDEVVGLFRLCIKPTEAMVQARLQKLTEAARPVIEQLRQCNGVITELDDTELNRIFDQHFNSDSFGNLSYSPSHTYNAGQTILESHWRNEMVFSGRNSFEMGQRHYGFVLVDLLPETVREHSTNFLRTLDADVTVVAQVERLDSAKTVTKLEQSHKTLIREQFETNTPALDAQIDSDASQARIIQSGRARPVLFRLSFLVRGKTQAELATKLARVNSKLTDMKFVTEFPAASATLSTLFFSTMPGVVLPAYRRGFHRTLHTAASMLLPLLSSFRGHKNAHAVLEGNAGNVVGLAAWEGQGQAEVPKHAVIVGPTGTGKSVFINWLLYVHSYLFSHRIIIDCSVNGSAYRRFLKTFGLHLEPIVLKGAKHQSSINPIDSNGSPFTETEMQAPLVSSIALLIGVNEDHMARADLDKGVCWLVRIHLEAWLEKKHNRAVAVATTALAIHTLAGEDTAKFFDAWHQWSNFHPEKQKALLSAITKDSLTRFRTSSQGKQLTWRLAASYLGHSEWVTFSNLVNVLKYDVKRPDLAKRLSTFTKGQSYGNFLDSPTNVDLNAPCVYFDFAGIGAHEVQLQAAIVSLIFGSVLSGMFKKPGRKAVMIDEGLDFLSMKGSGSDEMLARAFRMFRKSRCACYLVVHELKTLMKTNASEAIISNTHLWYVLHQLDESNLDALKERVKLPESALEEILGYIPPSQQPPDVERYADVYVHPAGFSRAQGGTARLYAPPIVLEMTETPPPKNS